MSRYLDGTLVHLLALAVPEAMRRRLLRHAGDAALRAELLVAHVALGEQVIRVGELVTAFHGAQKQAAEQRQRAARAEAALLKAIGERDAAWDAARAAKVGL